MRFPLFQIDAFTTRPFGGNPAAVCPLDQWLDASLMQQVAAENNLSETAFLVPRESDYALRWFTPRCEIELCGHATLAAGYVVLNELRPGTASVRFHTQSGVLTVARHLEASERRHGDAYELDLPAAELVGDASTQVAALDELERIFGVRPHELVNASRPLAVFTSSEQVRALAPDMAALSSTPWGKGVAVTSKGTGADADVDFVSRYFAPDKGVPEDPVTGSAHCALTPYWAERLKRNELRARQVSARVGELSCSLRGDRVFLRGGAVLVMRGVFEL